MNKCPLKSCKKPYDEHEGIERIVHYEKAEAEKGCRCPILKVGDYCPVHGG